MYSTIKPFYLYTYISNIDEHVCTFQMLIDIGVLVLCGQLLEPLWGALEFLVNQIINSPVCGLKFTHEF